jgi:hypothetical protein
MKLVLWMLAGSLLSSFVITTILGAETALEIWLGMLGPLTAALSSWMVMERQYIRRPEGMTALLIKAFAAKMIFFGGYITILLSIGIVRPIPFVTSFLAYFFVLHVVEAIGLHGLQATHRLVAQSVVHQSRLFEASHKK